MKNLKLSTLILSSLFLTTACSNDDTAVNEEELITTVITTLTGNGQIITLTARDLDGDGPNSPVITVDGNLVAGTTYIGSTRFLNELTTPADEITEEVQEEGTAHQVFYELTSNLGSITYNSTNVDENGKPIGLLFNLSTSMNSPSNGTLVITLLHLPNKMADGVESGDSTNAGGATDAVATFPLIIE